MSNYFNSGSPLHNLKKYTANILKAYFKDENNNAKNSIAFSNNTRNNPIEDDEIMVSFDVSSLYTSIPKIDTLNIIKDYVNIFNSQFYQQTDGVAVRGPAFSITAEIYMQAHEGIAISTAIHPRKGWKQFADHVYFILKCTYLENFFQHINNLHQNIKFVMEEEYNGEIALLDNLLKQNNGKISVLVYRKLTYIDQYLQYHSHHQTSCKESVVSTLFNRAYSIILNNDNLYKENARIKQMLKKNGYHKSIIS